MQNSSGVYLFGASSRSVLYVASMLPDTDGTLTRYQSARTHSAELIHGQIRNRQLSGNPCAKSINAFRPQLMFNTLQLKGDFCGSVGSLYAVSTTFNLLCVETFRRRWRPTTCVYDCSAGLIVQQGVKYHLCKRMNASVHEL